MEYIPARIRRHPIVTALATIALGVGTVFTITGSDGSRLVECYTGTGCVIDNNLEVTGDLTLGGSAISQYDQDATDERYLQKQGDTGTGKLIIENDFEVTGNSSGATVHAQNSLTSSGALSVEGTASVVGATTLNGAVTMLSTLRINGITYTYPGSDAVGSLTSDGAGALTWVAASGGADPNGSLINSGSLSARWLMDGASGNETDQVASLVLVERNGVGTDLGISEDCAESASARSWAGNLDHFEVADSAATSFTGDFTMMAWVNVGTTPASNEIRVIAASYNSTSDRGIYWAYTDVSGTPKLQLGTSSTSSTTALYSDAKTLTPGQWYFNVVTYDESAGAVDFYIDGLQVGSQVTGGETTLNDTTGKFRVGCYSITGETDCSSASNWDSGEIQDLQIYQGTIFTAAEVKQQYEKYTRGCKASMPTINPA